MLAFVVNTFVYFSFGNIYSNKILNYENFVEQFNSGVYQYRILSGHFLLWIYNFLGTLNLDYSVFKFQFLNAESEPQMYLSFYILNTFFLVLTAIIMGIICEGENLFSSNSEKLLMIGVGIFTIAISQFVIVPYDNSSYFFLILYFLIFTKFIESSKPKYLVISLIILVISTFNRESSALSLSLSATLLYAKFGLKKESILPVSILGIAFVATYFGMRFLSENFTTNDGSLLKENFTQPKNILGILFWLVFFAFSVLISKDKYTTRNILIFHFFSIPYILMCFYSGILYEIRLYVPIFLTSLFLANISVKKQLLKY